MSNRAISIVSGAAFILAASGFAFAADMTVEAPLPPPPPAPIYNWTGFYVGGNVGGAWSTTDWTFFNGGNFEPFSQDASSWIAGGQVGYRYQFTSNWVWGVEASWSGTDLNDTSLSVLNADRSLQSKITDLLLVTGSVGYAANNWLTRQGRIRKRKRRFQHFRHKHWRDDYDLRWPGRRLDRGRRVRVWLHPIYQRWN